MKDMYELMVDRGQGASPTTWAPRPYWNACRLVTYYRRHFPNYDYYLRRVGQ